MFRPKETTLPPQEAEIKVLQITDLHLLSDPRQSLLGLNTDKTFLEVIELAKLNHWPPDYIILSGDLAQEPTIETYRRLQYHLEKLKIPCLCLPGNHDDASIMEKVLRGNCIHFMERIVTRKWQVIPLNSQIPGEEGGYISSNEITKLGSFLEEYPDKFALLTMHHHPSPCQCEWMDTMVIKNWKALLTMLDDYNQAKTLICGHIHQEMDKRQTHYRILGCPSTCFQFKPNSKNFELDLNAPGYRWLNLFPAGSISTGVERLRTIPSPLDLLASGY